MRPRADERASLAGHLPAGAEDELLADFVQRYPDWEITHEDGEFIAVHRHEEHDVRRERAGICTTVRAPDAEILGSRLFIQRALRGDGAKP